MPTFISKGGILHPAKEKVSLKYKGKNSIPKDKLPMGVTISGDALNPGDDFLYDGPDRASLNMLYQEEGGEASTLGQDFRNDPEFIQSVRNRGFNTVDEYLKSIGYDDKKEEEKFSKKASSVQAHELEKRVNEIEVLAGGKDYTGSGEDSIGGFGEAQVRKPTKK